MTKYTTDPNALTPIQEIDGYWFKRDDLFMVADVYGGKSRSCWNLIQKQTNLKGLCTPANRNSPQACIVASIGKKLGLPVRIHTATGSLPPEMQLAKDRGAQIFQHKMGYLNVLRKRATDDCKETGFYQLPFGMEHLGILDEINVQMGNVPWDKVKRVVTISGSGTTSAGILGGLIKRGKQDFPVLIVRVGASRLKTLDRFLPDWQTCSNVEMVTSKFDYSKHYKNPIFKGIRFDSIYEAKYLPYLKGGDLIWIVGIHRTEIGKDVQI